jgi:Zn-dependent M32 family carboxypeptidase
MSATDIEDHVTPADKGVQKLAKAMKEVSVIRKVVRASARLADFITQEDREDCARVIREAKQATMRVYSKEKGDLIEIPDHKTRLAATTLELAYIEGTPVKRSVEVKADFESADVLIERLRSSPEAMRMFRAYSKQEIPLQHQGQVPDPRNHNGDGL